MSELSPCPITCPNRRRDARAGKTASYLFALGCSLFLGFTCVAADRRGEPVPMTTWMPLLLLVGAGLGVNVDPAAIGGLLSREKP